MIRSIIIQRPLTSACRCAIIACLMLAHPGYSMPADGKKMRRPAQCPGQVLSAAYRYRTMEARNALECASLCPRDDQCLAVLFEVERNLCHFGNATSDIECSNMEPAVGKMKYYEELVCYNGGNISADGTYCNCPNGYYGVACYTTYADCLEYDANVGKIRNRAVVWIKPSLAPDPFPVMCTQQSNSLMKLFILRRNDENAEFNRSWHEYRDGFGELKGSTFWLGLEKLHLITASAVGGKAYDLYLRVNLSDTSDFFYQNYEGFMVHNESTGYALSYNRTSGGQVLGDCLGPLQGAGFSTHDVDNDGSATVHCARQHGGGWWFKGDNCSSCNPLGLIVSPFDGFRKNVVGESFWDTLGNVVPFKLVFILASEP